MLIPTLSLTTAVKVTVCVCELVVNVILVLLASKLVIVGFWSSLLVILIVTITLIHLPSQVLKLSTTEALT